MAIEFNINGSRRSLDIDPETPLLEALRNDLSLNAPKFGCGLAQCGACAVLVDGVSIRSCVTPVGSIAEKSVITLEGLGTEALSPRIVRIDPRAQLVFERLPVSGLEETRNDDDAQALQDVLNGNAHAFLTSEPKPTYYVLDNPDVLYHPFGIGPC